jgi:2-polyprenyl-3-methyl-5-hydroxy-6-metoxy-1,4-benzoquinol methylase
MKELEIAHQAKVAAAKGEMHRTPDYIIERFRSNRCWRQFPKEYVFRQFGDLTGKEVLDFGCGDGENATQLARLGAHVTGIDISPELIDLARQRAVLDGVEENTEFVAADIEDKPFSDNSFDFVLCSAVIHHVVIERTVPLLYACLKPGGRAIMAEPIVFSPVIEKIRALIPIEHEGSPAERQLNQADIAQTVGHFDGHEITYFEMLGRLQRLFPNRDRIDRGHPFTKAALVSIHSLDRLLVTLLPFLKRYFGVVIIVADKKTRTA